MGDISIELEGYTMDVSRKGSGQPLLLIHGTASDKQTWQKHIDVLSQSYDVITPSLRYFGTQPWPDDGEDFGSTIHALDILKLIDTLALENVISVGWSYGGNVALHAALLKPRLFKSLFLYEPASLNLLEKTEDQEAATTDRQAMFQRTVTLLKPTEPTAVIDTFFDDIAGEPGAYHALPEHVKEACTRNAPMLNLLLSMKPTELSLNNFDIPTVIACGENSRSFYKVIAAALELQCKSITTQWIPNANHLWPAMDVNAFCKAVEERT